MSNLLPTNLLSTGEIIAYYSNVIIGFDDKQTHRSLDILHANNLLQGSREDRDRQGFLKTRKIDFHDAK